MPIRRGTVPADANFRHVVGYFNFSKKEGTHAEKNTPPRISQK